MKTPSLSLQLYSLRRETAVDPEGTLRQVSALGFDGVELAGDYGLDADKWNSVLKESGLSVVGAHVSLADIQAGYDKVVAFHRAIGNPRLIVPYLPNELRNTAGYQQVASEMNELAEKLRAEGFELLYHNHDFEFQPLPEGSNGEEILMGASKGFKFKVDTYWVERGGENSTAFIKRHAAQIGMIHAKELRKADNADVPAGTGDIDFPSILALAKENGWPVVVEFEGQNAPDALRQSASHLRTLL